MWGAPFLLLSCQPSLPQASSPSACLRRAGQAVAAGPLLHCIGSRQLRLGSAAPAQARQSTRGVKVLSSEEGRLLRRAAASVCGRGLQELLPYRCTSLSTCWLGEQVYGPAFKLLPCCLCSQVLAELAALADGGPNGSDAGSGGLRGAVSLAEALRQVHFVDAGLNCRGAHLTDPEAVQGLGQWCQQHPQLRVFLHGTPRQWGEWSAARERVLCGRRKSTVCCEGRPARQQHLRCCAGLTWQSVRGLHAAWGARLPPLSKGFFLGRMVVVVVPPLNPCSFNQSSPPLPTEGPRLYCADDPRRPWISIEKNRWVGRGCAPVAASWAGAHPRAHPHSSSALTSSSLLSR